MEITRTSIITQQTHTRDIDVTEEQLARWKAGANIQDACPHLSVGDREFIMTGITQEEWDLHMKDEDDR